MQSTRSLWVEDQYAIRCRCCEARFSIIRRRHHCRNCGQVFCGDCLLTSSGTVVRKLLDGVLSSLTGLQRDTNMRVCHKCSDIIGQRHPVQRRRQGLLVSNVTASHSLARNTGNAMTALERGKNNNETETQKCSPNDEVVSSYSGVRNKEFISSGDFTPSVVHQPPRGMLPTHAENEKEQEISYGLTDTPLYTPNSMSVWLSKLLKEARKANNSSRLHGSQEVRETRSYVPYPKAIFRRVTDSSELTSLGNMFPADVSLEDLKCFERLSSLHLIKRASRLFMKEILLSSLTDSSEIERDVWVAGICDISWRILSGTRVALRKHVTEHFDVICIPGDSFVDTEIISGIAFVKTIVSKRMRNFIEAPRILLLAGDVGITTSPGADALEFTEGNRGYLDKQYERIKVWKPSVIVVEGNMHHYLQEMIIRESDATLILHAGETTIHRLSRCCNAIIVRDLQYVSAEDLCNASFLGSCKTFQAVNVGGKPVSIFKGLPVFLFTTVLLRGGKQEELEAVKRILFNCAISAHHLALQAHCVFDLGMKCAELHEDEKMEKAKVEESLVGNPPFWGVASSSHYGECEEYMKLVQTSPRVEDRIETLSMNVGVNFSSEVVNIDEKYDDLIVDSIIVNTVFLNSVTDGISGGDGVDDATSGTAASISPNNTVRQSREVFPFYSEGDETLLEYLKGRVREGNSSRIILHSNKRIWMKVSTYFNNSQMRRTSVEGNMLSTRPMFSQSSLPYPFSGGFGEDDMQRPDIQCYAVCKNCYYSTRNVLFSSSPTNCSIHTLNISWGAFLELLVYNSSFFTLSCGHALSQSICFSFIFFTHSAEVTVSIMVEPLAVYDIITPYPTMPPCEDASKLYLNSEFDELRQSVMRVIASIQSVMTVVSGKHLQTSSQSGNTKQLCPSNNNVHNPAIDLSIFSDDEKGRILLKGAEDLLEKLTRLETLEGVIFARLEFLPNLIYDFFEWYNAKVLATERCVSRGFPTTVELGKIEDPYWAYNPRHNSGVRLNEPTSLVALAIQAMSLSNGNGTELNHVIVTSSSDNQTCPITSSRRTVEEEGKVVPSADETQQALLEESIELMFGADSIVFPDFSPSTTFLGTTFDAVETLRGRTLATKPTFKHIMNLIIPGGKNETANVTVEVMFPEQFAALQHLYTKGRTSELVFSLSRCRPLKPEGGKSKSEFFISLDGRFLMKQVKSAELKHFTEFGPEYFAHLSQIYDGAEEENTLSADITPLGGILAKIFGLFSLRISRKRKFSETPSEIRYFVLIENIFYARHVDVTYDLKGSQRNRNAPEGSSVLLDQNLINSHQTGEFFYCRNEVKSILMDRLSIESRMLSDCSIMDYSLLVGLNAEKRQLYLGMVDYLHPYKGAKVIESKVKAGIDTVLGHSGRDPTIIDPVSYRLRFARWMRECFCSVPDKSLPVRRAMEKENKQ